MDVLIQVGGRGVEHSQRRLGTRGGACSFSLFSHGAGTANGAVALCVCGDLRESTAGTLLDQHHYYHLPIGPCGVSVCNYIVHQRHKKSRVRPLPIQ